MLADTGRLPCYLALSQSLATVDSCIAFCDASSAALLRPASGLLNVSNSRHLGQSTWGKALDDASVFLNPGNGAAHSAGQALQSFKTSICVLLIFVIPALLANELGLFLMELPCTHAAGLE